jgi:hypothetical protein
LEEPLFAVAAEGEKPGSEWSGAPTTARRSHLGTGPAIQNAFEQSQSCLLSPCDAHPLSGDQRHLPADAVVLDGLGDCSRWSAQLSGRNFRRTGWRVLSVALTAVRFWIPRGWDPRSGSSGSYRCGVGAVTVASAYGFFLERRGLVRAVHPVSRAHNKARAQQCEGPAQALSRISASSNRFRLTDPETVAPPNPRFL